MNSELLHDLWKMLAWIPGRGLQEQQWHFIMFLSSLYRCSHRVVTKKCLAFRV